MNGTYTKIHAFIVVIALAPPVLLLAFFWDARFDSYLPITVYVSLSLLAVFAGAKPTDRLAPKLTGILVIGSLLAAVLMIVSTGASTRFTSFAVFQHGDAEDFYGTVAKLLIQGWFDTPRGRPFVNAAWAGAIDFFNYDLARVFLAAAGLAAISIIAVANRLGHMLGGPAGILGAALLIDYILEFIVGTTSELPGFLLGLASAALLVDSATTERRSTFFSGFALLCATMIVRPGAMFLLPIFFFYGWRFLPIRSFPSVATAVLLAFIGVGIFAGNGQIAKVVTPNSGGHSSMRSIPGMRFSRRAAKHLALHPSLKFAMPRCGGKSTTTIRISRNYRNATKHRGSWILWLTRRFPTLWQGSSAFFWNTSFLS